MTRDPATDGRSLFELQPLEPRVLLSAEGLFQDSAGLDPLADALHSPLFTSAIVESAEEVGTTAPATPDVSDDLFAVTPLLTSEPAPAASTLSTSIDITDTAAASIVQAPLAIVPTSAAPVLPAVFSVATLPNGPPAWSTTFSLTDSSLTPFALTDAANVAADITSGLTTLSAQLPTWGAFFNLGTIDWSAQGLDSLSLPVVPDTLSTLFGLGSRLSGVSMPDFSSATDTAGLVTQMTTAGFTIRSIEGGYGSGATAIAASTGTTLIEASYTRILASGLSIDAAFSGDPFNDATASLLEGLASSVDLDGTIAWNADLSLTINFVVDSATGFLLLGDSALNLTVTGDGTVSGKASVAGDADVAVNGTATGTLAIALGFHDPLARYSPSAFTAANMAATATGTAGIALTLTTGPLTLNYGAAYTLTANLATRVVTQAVVRTLAGSLQLEGVDQADGSQGVVALTGTFNSATTDWTLAGSSTALRVFDQKLTALSVSAQVGTSALAGTLTGTLELDFLRNASTPAAITLSGTYDRSAVSISGTATIASLIIDGSDGDALFSATDASLSATFARDGITGELTGTLSLNAKQAQFQPAATSFQATVKDGDDADLLAITGSYDFGTETYAVTLDQFEAIATGVFLVRASAVAATYDRRSTDLTATLATVANATVELNALARAGSSTPPTVSGRGLTLRLNGFSLEDASFALDSATIGDDLLELSTVVITLTNLRYTTGATPVIGTIGLTAATAELFAGQPDRATLTTVAGTLDCASHTFNLTAASLAGQVGESLTFSGTNVTFSYDARGPPETLAAQTVLTAGSLTASLAPSTYSWTLIDLTIKADGAFRAKALRVDFIPATKLGLGDFLPFNISSIEAVFDHVGADGLSALAHFDLIVTGAFDFDLLRNPKFTPIITIGEPAGTQQIFTEAASNSFTFSVTVDGTSIRPKDIGPITIGFKDLKVGDTAIVGATVSLGGYKDGVFLQEFRGDAALYKMGSTGSADESAVAIATATLKGGYETGDRIVVSGQGDFTLSFKYGEFVDVQNAQVNFTFKLATDENYQLSISDVKVTGASVEKVQIKFGSAFVFTAKDAQFNFDARGDDIAASFAEMDVSFPALAKLTGTAWQFGFTAKGELVALPGFGVALTADLPSLSWPDWLQIKDLKIEIRWPDLKIPENFRLILSATVVGVAGLSGLKVEGSINNLEIDFALLLEAKFPITRFDEISFGISGVSAAFGGSVEGGTLLVGMICYDSSYNVIPVEDITTAVHGRLLYGAIQTSFEFGGLKGFDIRIGASTLGPLEVYLEVPSRVLLDAASGLAITSFHAGVRFDLLLEDVTDPARLRDPKFAPQGSMDFAAWKTNLRAQAAAQLKPGPDGKVRAANWDVLHKSMVIDGGATLESVYAGSETFTANIDVSFDTEGRVLINARGTFGETVSMNFRLFTSKKTLGTFVFLADFPDKTPHVLSLAGTLKFQFFQADGVTPATLENPASVIELSLTGRADATLESGGSLSIIAKTKPITVRFAPDRFTLHFEDVLLDFEPLGVGIPVSGELNVAKNSDTGLFEVWGAGTASLDFAQLKLQGVSGTAEGTLRINTSATERTVSLGSAGDVTLAPLTFSIEYRTNDAHPLTFALGGHAWFRLTGDFIVSLSADGADMAFAGRLAFGAAYGGQTATLQLDVQGLIAVRTDGLALHAAATISQNFPALLRLSLAGDFSIDLNTTGRDVSYRLPNGDTIKVSGRLDAGTPAGPYLAISAKNATLTVFSTYAFHGSFAMAVAPGKTRLAIAAAVSLSIREKQLFGFSASGSITLEDRAAYGNLSLNIVAGLPADAGFDAGLSFGFEFDSRTSVDLLDGPSFHAHANFTASGYIGIDGVTFRGSFILSQGTDGVSVGGSFATEIGDRDRPLFTLQGSGGFRIVPGGMAGRLSLNAPTIGAGAIGWTISGTGDLAFNSTAAAIAVPDSSSPIAASTLSLALHGALIVGGFQLDGSFSFTRVGGTFSIWTNFTSAVTVGGVKLLGFTGVGSMLISSAGLVGTLGLNLNASPPASHGWSFAAGATFLLEANTTSTSQTFSHRELAAHTVRVQISGALAVGGFTLAQGTFSLRWDAGHLQLDAAAKLQVWDAQVSVTGTLALQADGVAVVAAFSAGPFTFPGASLSGTFALAVNTTGSSRLGLAAHSAYLQVTDATLSLLGLSLHGALRVSSAGAITVPADDPMTFSFMGATTSVSGTADLPNQVYSLTGTVDLKLGKSPFATIDVTGTVGLKASGMTLSLKGKIHAFGLDLGCINTAATLSHGGFAFSSNVSFSISPGKLKGSVTFTVRGNGSIAVAFDGRISVYSLSADASGSADTQSEQWTISSTLSENFGGKSLGASITINVSAGAFRMFGHIVSTASFHFSVSAWAKVHGHGVSASSSGDIDGDKIALKAKVLLWHVTIHINLSNGSVSLSQVAGATVFLDVNRNGVRDPGEPATLTDAQGSFTFNEGWENATSRSTLTNRLGALGRYDANGDGQLDASEGRLRMTGGTFIEGSDDFSTELNPTVGYTGYSGATVWFDANDNGRFDAGEVATTAEEDGFYNFLAQGTPVRDSVTAAAIAVEGPGLGPRPLGELAPFDTNANGRIDPQEGVFVITGGIDVNTGLPNTRTLTVSAGTYGSISGVMASPMAELLHRLRELGLTDEQANARLQTAFGLLSTMDAERLSAGAEALVGSGWADDIETISKQISFFVTTGAEMLASLARADGIEFDYAELEDAVEMVLARRIANMPPMAAFAAPTTPAVTLHEAAIISAFLDAAELLGLRAPSAQALDAASGALALIETRLQVMRDAALEHYTLALARLQAGLHEQFFPAVSELFAGHGTAADFTIRFSADGIRNLVRATPILAPNSQPTAAAIAPQVRHDEPRSVTFAVVARDPDGLVSDLNVAVASSNPWLIPTNSVSVTSHGNTFTLTLVRPLARTGHAVVTVVLDDGQGGTATRTFDVTIVYTYAALMNDFAFRARMAAAAEDDDNASESAPELPAGFEAAHGSAGGELIATPSGVELAAATSLDALSMPRPMQRL